MGEGSEVTVAVEVLDWRLTVVVTFNIPFSEAVELHSQSTDEMLSDRTETHDVLKSEGNILEDTEAPEDGAIKAELESIQEFEDWLLSVSMTAEDRLLLNLAVTSPDAKMVYS